MLRSLVGSEMCIRDSLYSAIATTDGSLTGDYFLHNGKKYYVCDPTCFYAPAGVTAKEMDNSQAVLIPIR